MLIVYTLRGIQIDVYHVFFNIEYIFNAALRSIVFKRITIQNIKLNAHSYARTVSDGDLDARDGVQAGGVASRRTPNVNALLYLASMQLLHSELNRNYVRPRNWHAAKIMSSYFIQSTMIVVTFFYHSKFRTTYLKLFRKLYKLP